MSVRMPDGTIVESAAYHPPFKPSASVVALDVSVGELPRLVLALDAATISAKEFAAALRASRFPRMLRVKPSGGRKADWYNRRRLAARSPR